MTLTFKLRRSSTKSKRTHKKFPRQKFKNDYTTARNLKEWAYCKHNWNDDDYTYIDGSLKKFLMCNIGRPINKVYSKFLSRCSNLGKFNPKEEFYIYIEDKESINPRFGGFYVTNGILNYKKPIKNNKSGISYVDINKKQFDKLDLHTKIKTLVELHTPQCLGVYYLKYVRKTVYIDISPILDDWRDQISEKHTRIVCSIPGVGYGINLNIIETQTGKTKYNYSIVNNWLQSSHPRIYFYYLNK